MSWETDYTQANKDTPDAKKAAMKPQDWFRLGWQYGAQQRMNQRPSAYDPVYNPNGATGGF